MIKKLKKEYVAPWEKAFDKVLSPLEDFIHRQTTIGIAAGLFLVSCSVSQGFHD